MLLSFLLNALTFIVISDLSYLTSLFTDIVCKSAKRDYTTFSLSGTTLNCF